MSRAKGDLAEQRACIFLQDLGFDVVERNFYSRFGEIDIILLKNETLHFVEVKSGLDYESAVQNITPTKLSRLIKTAQVYMKKNASDSHFQIDAVIIMPQDIEYIENITL